MVVLPTKGSQLTGHVSSGAQVEGYMVFLRGAQAFCVLLSEPCESRVSVSDNVFWLQRGEI